jgi:ABC-2 type transport system ATP-binding protein
MNSEKSRHITRPLFARENEFNADNNSLQILQVNKTYTNGVRALNEINLTIGNGMFGLLGPNGAGKSTLMRSIATLQNVDEGSILFNGQNIKNTPTFIRQDLGYLPQEFGVYAKFSAVELLDYIAVLKGITDKKARRNQINNLLEITNLSQEKNRAVADYSGGMRQRFGIAQALLGSPRILVIDEPTAGLDPLERQNLHNLLCELADQMIVILSTHIVEDVSNLCPQMAIMNQGSIQFCGTPTQALNNVKGHVWTKSVHRDELDAITQKHQVLSVRTHGGQFNVRAKSLMAPEQGFITESADLEDAYFDILNETNLKKSRQEMRGSHAI